MIFSIQSSKQSLHGCGRRLSASRTLLYTPIILGISPGLLIGLMAGTVSAQETPANPSAAQPGAANPPLVSAPASVQLSPPNDTSRATPQPGQFEAESIRYADDLVIAEAVSEKPVRFTMNNASVSARKITLDTAKRTVQATGDVLVERTVQVSRGELRPSGLASRERRRTETITETLRGNSFFYDFPAQQGRLDNAHVFLAAFDVSATEIIINGQRYVARNVILRPGGLTEAERKIYGTPPFNLRASRVTLEPEPGSKDRRSLRAVVSGAGLYYNNFRLLPVPSYVAQRGFGTSQRSPSAFTITPRVSFNSVDRFLLTTRLRFPFSNDPARLALNADIGASARIGFRGGVSLDAATRAGRFSLRGRGNDIITTQLTNRIVLNRIPEVQYVSPVMPLFRLPGQQQAGVGVTLETGNYAERTIGTGGGAILRGRIRSARQSAIIGFTTRMTDAPGLYLELFARYNNYSKFSQTYRNAGFEAGYEGALIPRIRGLVSYRSTSIGGRTPFLFDQVEIARELRSTVDLEVTPRYIIPVDLRYDLDRHKLRDRTFGLLRSYKTFAYGVVYQAAHNDLRLEVRQAF